MIESGCFKVGVGNGEQAIDLQIMSSDWATTCFLSSFQPSLTGELMSSDGAIICFEFLLFNLA